MKAAATLPLVQTIPDRCRTCYQCVRECPAKAIRIIDGQAEVIAERCIGCGNCVRVCNQHAKVAVGVAGEVRAMLGSGQPMAAIVAPSFPAEFPDVDHRLFVGMVKKLGFSHVNEVGFGADLVARTYRRLLRDPGDGRKYIATTCPAVLCYIEKYHPELVPALAPVVSPMVAAARALRLMHGPQLRIVFIGPCLAKRREALSGALDGEVAQAMTFAELRTMLEETGISPDSAEPSDFDPPHAGMGAIFPVERGLLQAAAIGEDLVANDVVSAGGRSRFVEAIREFAEDQLDVRLLEVLSCDGCIMGAGMTSGGSLLSRRTAVSRYVRQRMEELDRDQWQAQMQRFSDLPMSRGFVPQDQRIAMPSREDLAAILTRMGKSGPEDELNCGACGYETCVEHATAVHMGIAESEMCLPNTIEKLHKTIGELNHSHRELANAQEELVQSKKLASMGQLAAGIAHEINNPLGVVLMYAHLLLEEAEENKQLQDDLRMIADEADRCKKIVSGLLDFSRQNRVVRTTVDLLDLVGRTLRSLPPPPNVTVKTENRLQDAAAELDRDQIVQVLTNLITNAYTAMPGGGTLTVETEGDDGEVILRVKDTGVGIPLENQERIFDPFFTTKQIGSGTGLGLAVTYGIVKMHRGSIQCASSTDPAQGATGTVFTVRLPRKGEVGTQ
jgi:signal transduction histidine kinase/NAD-dependent dihydropyrimidine dehydrogenase PreA subunit